MRLSEPAHTALENDPAKSQHHGRLLTQAHTLQRQGSDLMLLTKKGTAVTPSPSLSHTLNKVGRISSKESTYLKSFKMLFPHATK